MRSNWDETRAKSIYHFDNFIQDPRWDTAIMLGKFKNVWDEYLPDIIDNSRPAMWANRGYKGMGVEVPADDLQAEEYDLSRAGMDPKMTITHLNWQVPNRLQIISNLFAFDKPMTRLHIQKPGEIWNLHIDKLQKWNPDDPSKVMRVFIHLTDWQPGQFWEYGNYHHNKWRAGECYTFDWANVPHSTANAGYHPRITMQITGIVTNKTNQFLDMLKSADLFSI